MKKLYVGNLSGDVTSTQIHDLFSQAGEITRINVVTDRETGDPKGFAFVVMVDDLAAQEAIKRFHGYSLADRALKVKEARPREDRFKSGRPGGSATSR